MLTTVACHFGLVALLAAGALAATRWAKQPELGHLLWLLVFIKLLIPPFVEIPLLPADTPPAVSEPATAPPMPFGDSAPAWLGGAAELDASLTFMPAAAPARLSAESALLSLWLAGALLYAVLLARSTMRFHRSLQAANCTSVELDDAIVASARRLGLRRLPRVLVIDGVVSPAMWPSCPATMLLPRTVMAQLTEHERRAVILHELVHYQRRDHWVRCLELLVLCVYWWLPPVWLFRRELRLAEEACCDRRVVRAMQGDAATYAEALIKTIAVLAQLGSTRLPRIATGAGALKPLRRRITMIMQYSPARPMARIGRASLFLAAAAALPLLPVRMEPAQDSSSADPLLDTTVQDSHSAGARFLASSPVRDPLLSLASTITAPPPQKEWIDLDPLVIKLAPAPPGEPVDNTAAEPSVTDAERNAIQAALDYLARDNHDLALAELLDSRDRDSSAFIDFTIANILMQQGRTAEATDEYMKAAEKAPNFLRAWKNLGVALIQVGRLEEAQQVLIRAIELGGNDAGAYGLLGYAQAELGDLSAAESAYGIARVLDPAQPDWQIGLLSSLYQQRRMADVIAMSEQMLQEQPDNRELHLMRANALVALGRLQEAMETLQRVEDLGGATPETLHLLGDINTNLGRLDEAVQAYLKAMQVSSPDRLEHTYAAARALLSRGEVEGSRALVDETLAKQHDMTDPLHLTAWLLLRARIAAAQGEAEIEGRTLERAMALDPENGETLLLLSRHYEQLGDAARALALLDRARGIADVEAVANLRTAQMLVGQKRYEEAVRFLHRAQELEPRENVAEYLEQVRRIAGVREQPPVEEVDMTEPELRGGPILIALTSDGRVLYSGREIGFDGVAPLLARKHGGAGGTVTIEADEDASAGVLVRLIDSCKRAGAKRVNVKTDESNTPVDYTELDDPPHALHQPAPALTDELRNRAPASATVALIVDEQGRVISAALQSSTDPAFNDPTMDAVRQWMFAPGLRNGEPVPFRLRVPFSYPAAGRN